MISCLTQIESDARAGRFWREIHLGNKGRNVMNKKIRYAIVGLGHIAQTAVLPAFKHAENSELAALITGNPEKDRELSER
jgi:hypothetical protein